METFSTLMSLCAWNSPVTGEFPHKGQWRGALMFSLISTWINGWVNNREAGDLRRHHAHYDVIVIKSRENGLEVKKLSLSKDMVSTKFSLAKGYPSKFHITSFILGWRIFTKNTPLLKESGLKIGSKLLSKAIMKSRSLNTHVLF